MLKKFLQKDMMQLMKNNRVVWVLLLMLACGLFLLGLNTNNYLYNVLTIIVTFFVYRKGYSDLFEEYDKKQRDRRVKAEQVYDVLYKSKQK